MARALAFVVVLACLTLTIFPFAFVEYVRRSLPQYEMSRDIAFGRAELSRTNWLVLQYGGHDDQGGSAFVVQWSVRQWEVILFMI
jgi:hypothetical protein